MGFVCVNRRLNGFDMATIQFTVPKNVIADTKIMFLGQLGGNPAITNVATLSIRRFQNCSHSISHASKSCFYHVYYETYREIRKFVNSAICNLSTPLSDSFEIAPIRFPMPENILVDSKIMFLS